MESEGGGAAETSRAAVAFSGRTAATAGCSRGRVMWRPVEGFLGRVALVRRAERRVVGTAVAIDKRFFQAVVRTAGCYLSAGTACTPQITESLSTPSSTDHLVVRSGLSLPGAPCSRRTPESESGLYLPLVLCATSVALSWLGRGLFAGRALDRERPGARHIRSRLELTRRVSGV